MDLWRGTHLSADRRYHAFLLGECREFARFMQAICQRPFTVNVLASLKRGGYEIKVIGNLDRHDDKINHVGGDESLHRVEGMGQIERRRRALAAFRGRVRDADNLELARQ